MTDNRANQVWTLDTTYIRMAKGFVYLTAVVDWASRKVLTAKIAITLKAYHAVEFCRRHLPASARLRSSIPIKGARSPLKSSFESSMPADANSAWTVEKPDEAYAVMLPTVELAA